jgi:putative oxidoreductase
MDPGYGLLLSARVLTGGAFLIIGLRNIGTHKMLAEAMRTNRFPLAGLLSAIGIAMQIGFGALMVTGYYPAVTALGLAAFTVLATLMFHSFWTFKAEDRGQQINSFLGNMIMTGGLLALAAAGL